MEAVDDPKQIPVIESQTDFICGVVEGFYGRPWTSEQRKDLFLRMKKIGMNSFLYAPKDDFKHRAYWRELYTVEEAEHLMSLIQAAKESSVTFYYAISPGLDIAYSNAKEVACLKRKLEQVQQLGCNAFALLFDDIEPEISETDKEVFQSFAHAQVSVTNECYQELGHSKFMFCPTEYCAARAVPNVQNSEYLNTVGQKLLPGIDIMWTGHKVISQVITVQQIEELTEVIRRPPVIWDNLHANDYDHKRLFLGPYSGRSPDLRKVLRGVLTNPNCEYEANFIPIHTLAQWSKCQLDGKILESTSADIRVETEDSEDLPQIPPHSYHPRRALQVAIMEWLPEFYKQKSAYGRLPIPPVVNAPPPDDAPSFPPLSTALVNTLVQPTPETKSSIEPMETSTPTQGSPKHEAESVKSKDEATSSETANAADRPTGNTEEMPTASAETRAGNGSAVEMISSESTDAFEAMQTEDHQLFNIVSADETRQLVPDDVLLLVDLFYLPFEHGRRGQKIVQEFQWLRANGHKVSNNKSPPDDHDEWVKRAQRFDYYTQSVSRLFNRLTYISNRSLLYDLYPYIWDIKGVISLLNSYVKWIGFAKGYKETLITSEQEPWLFRGGLTSELQRLLPLDSISDLFLYKPPESPSTKTYTIRPYLSSDEIAVYDICRRTCNDGVDGTHLFPKDPDLIGDKMVGGFLTLSPEFCFVVEDEGGVCGYALAALDSKKFYKQIDVAWKNELQRKYPLRDTSSGEERESPADDIVNAFHRNDPLCVPDIVYKHHPSRLLMSLLPAVIDSSVAKRLLACVLSALKAHSSHGAFCELSAADTNLVQFYARLGFSEILMPSSQITEMLFMGRTF